MPPPPPRKHVPGREKKTPASAILPPNGQKIPAMWTTPAPSGHLVTTSPPKNPRSGRRTHHMVRRNLSPSCPGGLS